MIDISGACDNRAHAQDAFAVGHLPRGAAYGVVADGLSEYEGSAAVAQTVVDLCTKEVGGFRGRNWPAFFRNLERTFATIGNGDSMTGATTLSLCVAYHLANECFVVEYIAIGDSPIIHAHPGPLSNDLPGTYICKRVHGSPMISASPGLVYGYVESPGGIRGKAYVGRFYASAGDVILLCSDGVRPERTLLLDYGRSKITHRFFNEATQVGAKSAVSSAMEELRSGNLLADDATLVALVLKAPLPAGEQMPRHQAEPHTPTPADRAEQAGGPEVARQPDTDEGTSLPSPAHQGKVRPARRGHSSRSKGVRGPG